MSQNKSGPPRWRPSNPVRRWSLAVAVVGLSSIGFAAPADAHTSLIGTDPGEGARLSSPPAQVQLKFNEEIEGAFVVVALARGAGKPIEVSNEVAGSVVTATLPDDAVSDTQAWKITYRVGSGDGHPVTGSVSFTVAPAAVAASPTPSDGASSVTPSASSTVVSSTNLAATSNISETGQPSRLILLSVMVVPVLGIIAVLLWRRRAS